MEKKRIKAAVTRFPGKSGNYKIFREIQGIFQTFIKSQGDLKIFFESQGKSQNKIK